MSFLLLHGLTPGISMIAFFSMQAALIFDVGIFKPSPWDRYIWISHRLSEQWWIHLTIGVVPVMTLLGLALISLGTRGLTTLHQERMLRLISVAILALAMPVADYVILGLACVAVTALAWAYGPIALDWLGVIELKSDPDEHQN